MLAALSPIQFDQILIAAIVGSFISWIPGIVIGYTIGYTRAWAYASNKDQE